MLSIKTLSIKTLNSKTLRIMTLYYKRLKTGRFYIVDLVILAISESISC
jgi:hypothetical protein